MKGYIALAALMVLAAGCGSDSTGPEGAEGTYTVDGFTFQWQQDPDSSQYLRVTLTAPTTGWVAVGFDPSEFMQDANLIIGYIDQAAGFVRDDYGTGLTTHAADMSLGGTSDVQLLSGSESGGNTTISFRIPYNSGDQYDKVLQEGQTYTIIFAYGADGMDGFTSAHVWAESASIEL